MKRCEKCSYKFKWKDIVISILSGYKPISCEICSTKYYVHFSARLITALIGTGLLVFVLKLPGNVYKPGIYVISFAVLIILSPFYTKYYTKG